jgi:hypothetical protein
MFFLSLLCEFVNSLGFLYVGILLRFSVKIVIGGESQKASLNQVTAILQKPNTQVTHRFNLRFRL